MNDGLWNVSPIRIDEVYGRGVPQTGPWAVAVFGSHRITEDDIRHIVADPFASDEGEA